MPNTFEMDEIYDALLSDTLVTHDLEPLKRRKKPKRYEIIGGDSEDDSEGNCLLFGFFDGKEYRIFDLVNTHTMDDVIAYIYHPHRIKKTLFFFHNLEYDLINMLKDYKYCFIDEMFYTSRLISAKFKDCPHEFLDSMNYMQTSLKEIGKIVGIEKGDYNTAKVEHSKLIEYMKIDCLIEYTFVNKFQNGIIKDFNIDLSPTIGSMAMKLFRKHYLNHRIGACSQPWCLDAYYGGRVELFKVGESRGNLCEVDFNGLYPFNMLKTYGDTQTLKPNGWIDDYRYGIGKFKIHVPKKTFVPPLPLRYNGRLYFPTGTLVGSWSYEEVRNAVRHGARIIKQYTGYGTNYGENYFEGFIKDLYGPRERLKKIMKEKELAGKNFSNEKFEDVKHKLFANNGYGKLCQHSDKVTLSIDPIKRYTRGVKSGRIETKKLGPFIVYTEKILEPYPTTNYFWGVCITANARIMEHNLLTGIVEAGHELFYCDTDSAIYEKKAGLVIPYNVSNRLGDLGEDHHIWAKFVGPKGYYLLNAEGKAKLACKGVNTDYALDFLTKGIATFKQPPKLRATFVSKELKENVWRDVTKTQLGFYHKRRFIEPKDGESATTYPISVDEIPEQERLLAARVLESTKKYRDLVG